MTGQWLAACGVRSRFFVCTQICHDEWGGSAVSADICNDLDLLKTDYLDLVYLTDRSDLPLEPVIAAISCEISGGRIRAFGVSNWAAERIKSAHTIAREIGAPGPAAIFTTELSLLKASAPLWPEYLPMDDSLRDVIQSLGLAVFAHADDLNIGQSLFGDEDSAMHARRHWIERWNHPSNGALVQRIQQYAAAHQLTPRQINIAWLLNQSFPSVAMIRGDSLLSARGVDYEGASQLFAFEL